MIRNIIDMMIEPLVLLFAIAVPIGFAITIQEQIEKKQYTAALIETIIIALIAWPAAILIALYVGYRLSKKKSKEENQEKNHELTED